MKDDVIAQHGCPPGFYPGIPCFECQLPDCFNSYTNLVGESESSLRKKLTKKPAQLAGCTGSKKNIQYDYSTPRRAVGSIDSLTNMGKILF